MEIRLIDVHKSYGKQKVLRELNLVALTGEFVLIRGKSGSGKSTLLRIIGLLLRPDSGIVEINDVNMNNLSDREREKFRLKNIGFIFQTFNLIPYLTIRENVELPLVIMGLRKNVRRERAMHILEELGIGHLAERKPPELSVGERQRAAIARALVARPKIILADEPTASLDDENTFVVLDLLLRAKKEGATVIMTTTDLVTNLPVDKDYMLKNGQLFEIK